MKYSIAIRHVLWVVMAWVVVCVVPTDLLAAPKKAPSRQTPQVVIQQIQQAIDTADVALFEQHVAIDSLLDQGVTLFIERLKQKGAVDTTKLPPMLGLMSASAQYPEMAASIRTVLLKELGDFVRYGVRSGLFAGKAPQGTPPEGMLTGLLAEQCKGRKTLTVAGKARRLSGKTGSMLVPVTVHDAGTKRKHRVDLCLRPVENTWQVYEINNLAQLMQRHKS